MADISNTIAVVPRKRTKNKRLAYLFAFIVFEYLAIAGFIYLASTNLELKNLKIVDLGFLNKM